MGAGVMQCLLRTVGLVLAATASLACGPVLAQEDKPEEASEPITLACLNVGRAVEACRAGAETWSEATGHQVEVFIANPDDGLALAQYEALLSIQSRRLDVLQIDLRWIPLLARELSDLAVSTGADTEEDTSKEAGTGIEAKHLASLIAPATQFQRIVAVPQFLSIGQWFYRTDAGIDAVPTEWDPLIETLRKAQASFPVQEDTQFWGLIFSGAAGVDLTATFMEWVASKAGEPLIAPDGDVVVDTAAAKDALNSANGWVGTLVPSDVSHLSETQANSLFTEGRGVMMRGWTHDGVAFQSETSSLYEKVGTAPLPAGPDGVPRTAMTAYYFGVSRFSSRPDVARELVAYLTSTEAQRQAAIEFGLPPTIESLYSDAEILSAHPELKVVVASLPGAVVLPVEQMGASFSDASALVSTEVSAMLAGEKTPEEALNGAQRALQRLRRSGAGW